MSQDFKLPPSLVAVKAFQQTAGKTALVSGGETLLDPLQREILRRTVTTAALNHPLPFYK